MTFFWHRARTRRELPVNNPFVVQIIFIDVAIKEWRATSLILCKTVHAALSDHVKKLVNKHFSEFGQGHSDLEQRIKSFISPVTCRVQYLSINHWHEQTYHSTAHQALP